MTIMLKSRYVIFFFQAEDGIRDRNVTGVQTCALPISGRDDPAEYDAECHAHRHSDAQHGGGGRQYQSNDAGTLRAKRHANPYFLGTLIHGDRKSTRLNSSHVSISYAVFCLKKKKPNPR